MFMKAVAFILRFMKRIIKAVLPAKAYDKLRDWFYRNFVLRKKRVHVSDFHAEELPRGINLFIHNMNNSAGVEGRLLRQALESAGIVYRIYNLSDFQQCVSMLSVQKPYNVNLVACHAASETPLTMLSLGLDLSNYFNIGYWAWELNELPDVFCSGLDIFQENWTISNFCTKAFEKRSRVPVLTVPLHTGNKRKLIQYDRHHFNIDENVYLFMIAYDCNSFVSRKNPHAAVEAFLEAFTPEDRRVGLLLKTVYSDNHKEHIEELLETLSLYANIYHVDQYLSDDEMESLIRVSDTFVSLHRAEGFGNLPLEAMALGTSVISTAWSGNMEYMNHMNTALVGYNMIPVNGEYVGSIPGDNLVWADPDISEASAHMRRMVSDKAWRDKLIKNGKYTADECYNATNVGKIMRDRLEFLNLT
jgi:glycosyltransferase involved in cell wall biosynthesis